MEFEFDACNRADNRAAIPEYAEMYKKALLLTPTTPDVAECLVNTSRERLVDLDNQRLNFHVGSYTMGPYPSKCLIKYSISNSTEETTVDLTSYGILKNIRHHNIVTIENFYDANGHPRLVLSWVNGTLKAWLQSKENQRKFFSATISRPCSWFRQMAIDISSTLEYLFDNGVYPPENCLDDLYFCTAGAGSRICPKLLIVEGKSDDVRDNLPADLEWPTVKSGDVHPVLCAVIDYEKNKRTNRRVYNISEPYDFLAICRNILKHWFILSDKVPYLKRSCSDRDDFIRMMESWDKKIWFNLYEAIGWPGES
ncbi:hypothetical protein QOZ80_1BG0081540 [Eleusine coracana subsp. coracana]|nr:hypothetical protein QOZ80_1BG0081540 [Eleusine coracana subsp. coracana]